MATKIKNRARKIRKSYWVNEEENAIIKSLSKTLGISESEIHRKNINKKYIYLNLFQLIKKEFSKQGINLNQIATYANTHKELDIKIITEIQELKQQQKEILQKLQTL